MLATE